MSNIKELKEIMIGKDKHLGCLCCGGTDDILNMKTVLYNSFGGWTISKDGETYFIDDSKDEFENWDNITTLEIVEVEAKQFPKSKWIAHLMLPLREATYQRSECGNWVLIATGMGFA